ncbi:MAG: hypothetical protein COA69_07545 [Robiginitomaculum sp.]|nr:MAG: hypothetical protein COA69_07545 [Robiginitomaculum sp.]
MKLPKIIVLMCLLFVASLAQSARAQSPKSLSVENIEAWADREFMTAYEDGKFSAAALAVVQDGKLVFSRGYGYADIATQTPMDPANTRVRVCSTTKLYVATALMQLVDQGLIKSLDDPVNDYITRIKLPNFKGREITFRDLTTHRGGFEDQYFNAGTRTVVPTPSSAKIVKRLIPNQVREPGTLSVYSNANTALQGVVIEDLTGMTLKEYLTENIFEPLGMSRTVFNDNPPVPEGTAQPYARYKDGHYEAMPIVAKHPVYAPSGGLYSTAEDMAKFITAHMDGGHSSTLPLITPASFKTMHTPYSRNHPALGAIGVQFFLEELNGQKIIQHGCGLAGFTSYVLMLPELNTGVFFSITSTRNKVGGADKFKRMIGDKVPEDEVLISPNRAAKFYWSFLKEFVGFPNTPAIASTPETLAPYVGHYKVERRDQTTMLEGGQLLFAGAHMMDVKVHPDGGGLSINGSDLYRPIAPDVFQRGDHPNRTFAFERGKDGKVTRMLRSTAQAWTPVPTRKSSHTLKSMFLIGLCLSLSGLVLKLWSTTRQTRATKWALRASLLVVVAFILMWMLATLNFRSARDIEYYVYEGGTWRLWALAVLTNLTAVSGLVMIAASVMAWRDKTVTASVLNTGWRFHLLALAIGGVLMIYALANVHLIGFFIP